MARSIVESLSKAVVDLSEKEPIRVLHVDDEAGFLKTAKPCLEMQGAFQVETASSVEKAIEIMKEKTFDAIVSDYMMPEKDGLQFLKELREEGNNVPFIMFTGKGKEEVAIRALNLGADRYLNKTGYPETVYGELAYSIRKSVKGRQAEEAVRENQQKFERLFMNNPEAADYLDPDFYILNVNPRFEELFGYSLDEIKGKHINDVIVPKDKIHDAEMLDKEAKNGYAHHDSVRKRKDGSLVPVSISAAPIIIEGQLVGSVGLYKDITERKRAEEKLRESEEKLRNIFECANDCIFYLDKSGRIIDVNRKAVQLFGRTKKELFGRHFARVGGISLRNLPKITKAFAHCLTGKQHNLDVCAKNRKGRNIPLECSSSLVKADGKITGVLIIAREVTEHKESEERYQNIVELAPDGIVTIDKKGVITSVNTAFSKLTGYSKGEIVGKHFTKLGTIQARDFPRYMKLMGSALRGKLPPKFEFPYIRKDGTTSWGEAHAGLLKKGGKTVGFQAILRDITERKKAEENIRENQQKFEQLFKGNPEAAVYVDPDFRILDVNPRFNELFRYSLKEIKGKHINDVVVPKSKIEEAKLLDKKAQKGYTYQDTLRKRKDGTLVSVSISAAPIVVKGKHIGYVAVYKDISQLKQTERELKNTLEKLKVVGSLSRHDVRNKLSVVTNNVYLARQTLTGGHKALEYLRDVESAVQQMERIFDFARTYEKLGMEELSYTNVEKTFGEVVTQFSDLHGIKVVNDCLGSTVLADSLLRQLFYNLVDNSLKHGEKASQIRIHYEEEAGNDQLKLVYEDDGVGISRAEKEKIFMEGYGKGTGYGLYLIKKMCEVYGWRIEETGKQGKGAQFTITIPKMNESGKTGFKLY